MPITQLCVFERDGRRRVGALREEGVYDLSAIAGWQSMDDVLSLPLSGIRQALRGISWVEHTSFGLNGVALKAPLGSQEVWAAGVTYVRSRRPAWRRRTRPTSMSGCMARSGPSCS